MNRHVLMRNSLIPEELFGRIEELLERFRTLGREMKAADNQLDPEPYSLGTGKSESCISNDSFLGEIAGGGQCHLKKNRRH